MMLITQSRAGVPDSRQSPLCSIRAVGSIQTVVALHTLRYGPINILSSCLKSIFEELCTVVLSLTDMFRSEPL